MSELADAQARKAVEQLRAEGWAVGPPVGRDEWRAAVRRAARRDGLRVRTGEARDATRRSDDEPRPWAVTVEAYEAMYARSAHLGLATFGGYAVSAAAGRQAARVAQRSGAEPKM